MMMEAVSTPAPRAGGTTPTTAQRNMARRRAFIAPLVLLLCACALALAARPALASRMLDAAQPGAGITAQASRALLQDGTGAPAPAPAAGDLGAAAAQPRKNAPRCATSPLRFSASPARCSSARASGP
jgi:hypothetical protein